MKPADGRGTIAARREAQASNRAIVDIAGARPRTRQAARLQAGGGAELDTADGASAVDASVGFLLNRDKLNVGKLRT